MESFLLVVLFISSVDDNGPLTLKIIRALEGLSKTFPHFFSDIAVTKTKSKGKRGGLFNLESSQTVWRRYILKVLLVALRERQL